MGCKNAGFMGISELIARSILRIVGFGRCPNRASFASSAELIPALFTPLTVGGNFKMTHAHFITN